VPSSNKSSVVGPASWFAFSAAKASAWLLFPLPNKLNRLNIEDDLPFLLASPSFRSAGPLEPPVPEDKDKDDDSGRRKRKEGEEETEKRDER